MKVVAQILALYMLLGSCFPKTDFSQLLRLADLSTHYSEHRNEALAQGKRFEWLSFIEQHFLHSSNNHHESEEQHANLPLHSIDSSVVFNLLIDTPKKQLAVFILTTLRLPSFQDLLHQSGYRPGVFHPPSF